MKNDPDRADYPAAPEGHGPVLEWHQGRASTSILGGFFLLLILFLFMCLRDWGISWMSTWWLWLFIAWPPFVFYFIGKSVGISAGADWFAVKTGYVETYELAQVKVVGTSGGLAWDLELKDKQGNELSINLREIQTNRDLWDLVYNGIVHSVQRGSAKTNTRALDKLKLR
ncbi:hypothetical protein BJ969_003064 [Saccharopolyspora gloriosae]|uniref:Uncharacterized protein n=1 Tax=Saccharopolyspora gloriosae TaxID=455344 RepID=A0A840NCF8_9PSEU|nr:hypothetical protein [Saccharopolyspora gloriosae]MBB5069976.1 hypothetical protein [Saccharopolyspora gloriosae]